MPLLRFSADTGARAVRHIAANADFLRTCQQDNLDALSLAVVGAGVSDMSAALEARETGFSFAITEANKPFSELINFPKGKLICTYTTDEDRAKLSFSDGLALLRGNDSKSSIP